MKARLVVLVMCLVVIAGGLAMFGLAPARGDLGGLPNPEVYLIYGTTAVTSTEATVAVNSVTLTETFQVEGRMFWKGPEAAEGTFLITAGALSQGVEVFDLQFSEVYSDFNGVRLTANAEDWGRTGLVVYQPEDGRRVYTFAGYGYDLGVSEGTLFWDFAAEVWQVEPLYGFFTVVSMLEQVPTPEPTPAPEMFQVFLPLVSVDRPPTCLAQSPFEMVGWQVPTGYVVCSWAKPGTIDGVEPTRVSDAETYNWIYAGKVGPQAAWFAPGAFEDDLVSLETSGQAGISVVCEDCLSFHRIYAVWGLGYQLLYWPNQASWYDGARWVSTPTWSEFTLIGVK